MTLIMPEPARRFQDIQLQDTSYQVFPFAYGLWSIVERGGRDLYICDCMLSERGRFALGGYAHCGSGDGDWATVSPGCRITAAVRGPRAGPGGLHRGTRAHRHRPARVQRDRCRGNWEVAVAA